MVACFSPSAADVSVVVPMLTSAAVCTPAHVPLKRLSQASGPRVRPSAVLGVLQAEALAALTATGASCGDTGSAWSTLSDLERADVVGAGIDREEVLKRRLTMAVRCLASGGCFR